VTRHRILLLPIAALAVLLAIAACTPSASSAPQATTSNAPSSGPGGAQQPGPGGGDFAKIQQCLQAAGLTLPTGSFPRPNGSFAPPNGSFTPPNGSFDPGAFPSGLFPGGSFAPPGGLGGVLSDPKVQAALKACGLSLPGGAPSPSS
jgi:hypothetical protein